MFIRIAIVALFLATPIFAATSPTTSVVTPGPSEQQTEPGAEQIDKTLVEAAPTYEPGEEFIANFRIPDQAIDWIMHQSVKLVNGVPIVVIEFKTRAGKLMVYVEYDPKTMLGLTRRLEGDKFVETKLVYSTCGTDTLIYPIRIGSTYSCYSEYAPEAGKKYTEFYKWSFEAGIDNLDGTHEKFCGWSTQTRSDANVATKSAFCVNTGGKWTVEQVVLPPENVLQ